MQRLRKIFLLTGTTLVLSASPASASFQFVPPSGSALAPAPVVADASIVQGFATDVPLTVALRQLLPRGYVFSVSENVDLGTRVSWQGGASWQQVLESMLDQQGLRAIYSDKLVMIEERARTQPLAQTIKLRPPSASNGPVIIQAPTAPAPSYPAYDSQMAGAPTSLTPPPAAAQTYPAPAGYYAPPPGAVAADVIAHEPGVSGVPMAPAGPAEMMAAHAPHEDSYATNAVEPGITGMAAPMAATMSNDSFTNTGATAVMTEEAGGMLIAPPGAVAESLEPLPGENVEITQAQAVPMLDSGEVTVAEVPAFTDGLTWDVKAGDTLKDVLVRWCALAGVELNWLSEYNFPIQASMTFSGEFTDAVRELLEGLSEARPQPIGKFYRHTDVGHRVLIIETQGNADET